MWLKETADVKWDKEKVKNTKEKTGGFLSIRKKKEMDIIKRKRCQMRSD